MLFGEYLVLKGAKSLAFPVKYGQTLEIEPAENGIVWTSISPSGKWFEASFDSNLDLIKTNNEGVAQNLKTLLQIIQKDKPELEMNQVFTMTADFNLEWGFGSSSTFISLLSQWSGTDPYVLLDASFGGSGYDIACATAKDAVVYQITDQGRFSEEVSIAPELTEKMLFVYLGQKQSSKNEIAKFDKREITAADITSMNDLVDKAIKTTDITEFESLLNQSEDLLAPIIGRKKLKEGIFADYKYSIKSLGAWGGDYFLATFRDLDEAKNYFRTKGHDTMFTYNELIK